MATIVGLATDIDNTAKPIKQDFIGIDANVAQQGRGGNFASHINGHANSIDCSAPFDLLGLDDTLGTAARWNHGPGQLRRSGVRRQ